VLAFITLVGLGYRCPELPTFTLWALPAVVIGVPMVTAVLWDHLRTRPLARELLPKHTAALAQATALTAKDARARRILGL
jgi:hypothetical protein